MFKEDMGSLCLSFGYHVGSGFLKVSEKVWKGLANIFTWKDENSEQQRTQRVLVKVIPYDCPQDLGWWEPGLAGGPHNINSLAFSELAPVSNQQAKGKVRERWEGLSAITLIQCQLNRDESSEPHWLKGLYQEPQGDTEDLNQTTDQVDISDNMTSCQ